MTKLRAIALMASCSCAIDDRRVEVQSACVAAPDSGVISDFSTARLGRCPWPMCTDAFYYEPAVALGVSEPVGLIVPYVKSDGAKFDLGLTGDLSNERDDDSALRIVMEFDSLGQPTSERAGFALRLTECVDVSSYAGVSFRTAGDFEPCVGLRFAAKLGQADQDAVGLPCPIDDCYLDTSVVVTPGVTTHRFQDAARTEGGDSLTTLQWEASTPVDQPIFCNADFTIDDVRLLRE